MKKVLIITYYWPPSGGSGVQRWLKMSKYLPEFGWEPVILTPENPSFINEDPSLLNDVNENVEVLKLPIWEPYNLFGWIQGKKRVHQKEVNLSSKRNSFKEKLILWIRGNLLIPDPRIFWVKPVIKFLNQYLSDSGIQHIITTGPPHSLHLIGLKLKKNNDIKWIADFRDPWSEYDLLDGFYLTRWARKRHKKLENKVLKMADCILSVGWQMNEDMKRLGAANAKVLTNGFDHEDFLEYGLTPLKAKESKLCLRHIGTVDEFRNPRPIFEVLAELINEGEIKKDLISLEFIGNVNPLLVADVKQNPLWSEFIEFKPYVAHKEIIMLYGNTDILLLVLAHTHLAKLNITGKIFEYIATGVPILGIGDSTGDAAKIIEDAGAGEVVEHNDKDKIKATILSMINGSFGSQINLKTSPYTRKNLAKKLVEIINTL